MSWFGGRIFYQAAIPTECKKRKCDNLNDTALKAAKFTLPCLENMVVLVNEIMSIVYLLIPQKLYHQKKTLSSKKMNIHYQDITSQTPKKNYMKQKKSHFIQRFCLFLHLYS